MAIALLSKRMETNKQIKEYRMTTYTGAGTVFKANTVYKTKQAMRRAKEKQNLSYGAHLKADCVIVYQDGSTELTYCLA